MEATEEAVNFIQNTHNRHPIVFPMKARYGVSFVSSKCHLGIHIINGLVQERCNALELSLFGTNPSYFVAAVLYTCNIGLDLFNNGTCPSRHFSPPMQHVIMDCAITQLYWYYTINHISHCLLCRVYRTEYPQNWDVLCYVLLIKIVLHGFS